MIAAGSKEGKVEVLPVNPEATNAPTLGDRLVRRDIVAVYKARKLIAEAEKSEEGSFKRVALYEMAVAKLNSAEKGAEERLRKSQDGAIFTKNEAKRLRSETYAKLAEALRELGGTGRDQYLKCWGASALREQIYGKMPWKPAVPHDALGVPPAMAHGIYGVEGPAFYHYIPSRGDSERHDTEIKRYEKECNEFFEGLAQICEKKAGKE